MPNHGALGDHCTACGTDEVCKASHLYVIELRSEVLDEAWFQEINPRMDTRLGAVYVGSTTHHPLCRFSMHQNCPHGEWKGQTYTCVCPRYAKGSTPCKIGNKSSKKVKGHMTDVLRPDLYASLNPVLDEEATLREEHLADHLRSLGYGVWSN